MVEHNKQSSHKLASEGAVEFLSQMEKGKLSVSQLLQDEISCSIMRNRQKLYSILKAIIFCGKQNIPLRGHAEHPGTGTNPGNFLALLNFRVDAGDHVLANHLDNAAHNAQYKSPQIQNDLISCVGEWIRNEIIQEVITARFFSVCR